MNRFLIVILCFLLAACRLHAQQPPLRNFSVKDGLPSGIVYDCLEDKNGFMWFATEAGLARFDGSGFKVFTTADGLTNNIIIQLVEDIDGSIWIFPFGTSPCIYDQRLHKILNEKDYPELAKIGVEKEHMFAYKTATGIATNTKVGFWIFEQRRARKINAPWVHHIILKHTAREILVVGTDSLHAPMYSINYNRKDSEWVKGEKTLFNFSDFWKMGSVSKSMESRWNDKLIMANRFSLNFFRLMAEPGAGLVKEKAIQFTDPVQKLCDSDSLLYVCTTKGVHIYDKDFRFRGVKWPGISISTVYSDKRGNEWICTVDGKGVLLQVNGKTSILNESSGLPTDNIMSVATNNRDVVYTGDVTGNIAALNLYQFPTGKQLVAQTKSWVRQLFYDPNGVLWGFDNTEIIKYDHGKILKYRDDFAAYKALNVTADTILMASVFDLHMFDARLKNREWALNGLSRIICIASTPTYYYIGNNAGLYKVDRGHQKQAIPPALIPLPVTDPVTALVYTPNGLLLAGTSARGLVVLKNDKVLAEITLQKHIQSPGNYTIKKITVNNRRNRVWLATNKGAMAIDYRLSGNDFRYTSHVLAFKDGLADNDVNDIALMGDTVVAATIKGLTIFHDTLSESRLPLRITGVSANKTELHSESGDFTEELKLKYNQNNIGISYTAICFTCAGDIGYEFRLIGQSRDTAWLRTTARIVEFGELAPGNYIFEVRTGWSETQRVRISITPAFWQTRWFYAAIALGFLFTTFLLVRIYITRIRKKQQQQIALNKKMAELELKALQSQMNPHFIFNSMNSLQLYILTQDIEKANDYLAGFSTLLRLFLEASRSRYITISKEIELLNQYMKLEQMRQIGSFEYRITTGDNVDTGMLIPSVVVQPFVENAIVHGLRHREGGNGRLLVHFDINDGYFICTVEDNGVGREQARQIRERKEKLYESFGTSLVMEKIETLRKMEQLDIDVQIADLESGTGAAAGTRVTISIKLPVSV